MRTALWWILGALAMMSPGFLAVIACVFGWGPF